MPVRTSPQKESQIVDLYLRGLGQSEMARRLNVSQSTVSAVVSRFEKEASGSSLEAACARRGLRGLLDELRSLSVDMKRAGLTADEARTACRLKEEISKFGGDIDILEDMIAVYRKIAPEGYPIEDFVKATVEMVRLEKESRKGYGDLLDEYKGKQAKIAQLEKDIGVKGRELEEVVRKKKEEEAALQKCLEENKIKLEEVATALKVRESLDNAGLSLERGETVAHTLKVFSDLVESKGLKPQEAASKLQDFLQSAQSLSEAEGRLKDEVANVTDTRDSLTTEVKRLESEKSKLALENSFLKEAIGSVLELRERHEIGVDEIVKIRTLAKKYGPPASILQALDTYGSLEDVEKQKANLEGSVRELTHMEESLKGRIKTIEDALEKLLTKTDDSIRGVTSSLQGLSNQVQALGGALGKASMDVAELKAKALAAGRDVAAAESRARQYELASKVTDFIVNVKGDERYVVILALRFLRCLSDWLKDKPKYSEVNAKIKSLEDMLEGQLLHG